MFWIADALNRPSQKVWGVAQTLKNQTSQLAQCSKAGNVLPASDKPRLAHLSAKQRSMTHHSTEHVSTASQSGHGDVKLAFSSSAVETHVMKFLQHSVSTDIHQLWNQRDFSNTLWISVLGSLLVVNFTVALLQIAD